MRHARPEVASLTWWDRLWRPFWVLPAVVATASVVLGAVLPHVDERVTGIVPTLFDGGPDGARQLLGTIASAMISVTGLVFSITMVVLQLASSQFIPRLLGTFLASRTVQLTLGVFTGSFLYSLTVLRSVRGAQDGAAAFVPQASVGLSFLFVVASVGFFIAFIHHITSAVHLNRVISRLGARTRESIDRLSSGHRPQPTEVRRPQGGGTVVRMSGRHGWVTVIDSTGLVRWAEDRDCLAELDVGLGDFVVDGQAIGTVWASGDVPADEVASFVAVDRERHMGPDFGFGIRQLTDIAERALSPGVNDPTTAVEVLHELHTVLVVVAAHPDLPRRLVDDDGVTRATYRAPTFARTLEDSLGEIAHYARDAPSVMAVLRGVLDELLMRAVPAHAPAISAMRARIDGEGDAGT